MQERPGMLIQIVNEFYKTENDFRLYIGALVDRVFTDKNTFSGLSDEAFEELKRLLEPYKILKDDPFPDHTPLDPEDPENFNSAKLQKSIDNINETLTNNFEKNKNAFISIAVSYGQLNTFIIKHPQLNEISNEIEDPIKKMSKVGNETKVPTEKMSEVSNETVPIEKTKTKKISDITIMAVQRLPRYVLLLKEAIKHIPENETSLRDTAKKAYSMANYYTGEMNEATRQAESRLKEEKRQVDLKLNEAAVANRTKKLQDYIAETPNEKRKEIASIIKNNLAATELQPLLAKEINKLNASEQSKFTSYFQLQRKLTYLESALKKYEKDPIMRPSFVHRASQRINTQETSPQEKTQLLSILKGLRDDYQALLQSSLSDTDKKQASKIRNDAHRQKLPEIKMEPPTAQASTTETISTKQPVPPAEKAAQTADASKSPSPNKINETPPKKTREELQADLQNKLDEHRQRSGREKTQNRSNRFKENVIHRSPDIVQQLLAKQPIQNIKDMLDSIDELIQTDNLSGYKELHALFSNEDDVKLIRGNTHLFNRFAKLNETSATLMANALMAFDKNIYGDLDPYEYFDMALAEDHLPTLNNCIDFNNQLPKYVVTDIVSRSTIEESTQAIEYWIKVAEKCRDNPTMADMNVAVSIVLALNQSSVSRLTLSFAGLSAEAQKTLESFSSLLGQSKNNAALKQAYPRDRPYIPFINIIPKDALFILDGNRYAKSYITANSLGYHWLQQQHDNIKQVQSTPLEPVSSEQSVKAMLKKGVDKDAAHELSVKLQKVKPSEELLNKISRESKGKRSPFSKTTITPKKETSKAPVTTTNMREKLLIILPEAKAKDFAPYAKLFSQQLGIDITIANHLVGNESARKENTLFLDDYALGIFKNARKLPYIEQSALDQSPERKALAAAYMMLMNGDFFKHKGSEESIQLLATTLSPADYDEYMASPEYKAYRESLNREDLVKEFIDGLPEPKKFLQFLAQPDPTSSDATISGKLPSTLQKKLSLGVANLREDKTKPVAKTDLGQLYDELEHELKEAAQQTKPSPSSTDKVIRETKSQPVEQTESDKLLDELEADLKQEELLGLFNKVETELGNPEEITSRTNSSKEKENKEKDFDQVMENLEHHTYEEPVVSKVVKEEPINLEALDIVMTNTLKLLEEFSDSLRHKLTQLKVYPHAGLFSQTGKDLFPKSKATPSPPPTFKA